ncbi:RNA-directed DNA polymerase, eukaryota, reverse transcriptase zinc-binding domain protein, partial [Tanacetum coccineum]
MISTKLSKNSSETIRGKLLRGYNSRNGSKRFSLTIDIQKAYDTVSWSFLEKILNNFGFPSSMIQWIMVCISTPKFSICVNGERFGYFKGGRCLRQGDPISPYLFTLIMEVLNLFLKDEIAKERNFKYHFGCKKPKIIHLCFADDLLVLVKDWKSLVDKVKKKLGNWKNKSLSYVGRGFLWCNGELTRGKAKIAWKDVCMPKEQGGFGIKPLEIWDGNQALAKNISKREVHLAGFDDHSKLYEIIDDNNWKQGTGKGKWILDSHEHLFFQCKPVAEVWKIMKGRARIKTNAV